MRTIAIANQKGGCGKTTTALNLAVAFAQKGMRVLMLDLDPQAHSTLGLGRDPEAMEKTIYDVLINTQIPVSTVIVDTDIEGLALAPASVLLSGAELELASVLGRELVLKGRLDKVSDEYDMCIIDCPPSIGMLTLNALIASDEVIVPVQVHYYAMEGLKQLFETVNIITERFPYCRVRVLGVLLTFVENRIVFSQQVQQQMREFFGDLVFRTVIHKGVRLTEAPSAGQSVLTYAPDCRGADEYKALAEEVLNKDTGPVLTYTVPDENIAEAMTLAVPQGDK